MRVRAAVARAAAVAMPPASSKRWAFPASR